MNKYGEDFFIDFNFWYSSCDISTCEERWKELIGNTLGGRLSEGYFLGENDN